MRIRLTPVGILTMATMIGLVLVAVAVVLAVRQPWLGLNLSNHPDRDLVWIDSVDAGSPAAAVPAAATLVALIGPGGERIKPAPGDLIEDPDGLATYAQVRDFLARQSRLAAIMAQETIGIESRGEDAEPKVTNVRLWRQRPVGDLPLVFWVQALTGLFGFLISVWVWSLKPGETGPRLFALAGAGLMISALPAAVYSTRELALDGGLFRVLSGINHAGALLFGAAMIGLFLSYPRRLVRPRWLAVPTLVLGVCLVVGLLELSPGPPIGLHLPVTLAMLTILACAGLQYRRTRGDPSARAALGWFSLAVTIGAGAFVTTIIAPHMIGVAPVISQGYAFPLFLIIHAGLALGVARYRLFELDDWAFSILFYLGGTVLLLVLDAALIYVVALERLPAFSLSLLTVAFLYLPLRSALASWLLGRRPVIRENMFRQVVDVALAPPGVDQTGLWRQLVQDVFDPLRIDPSPDVGTATLSEDGLALLVPGIGTLPALRLEHAGRGRRLFSARDASLAAELHAMLRHAVESRESYEKGAAQERERIALDIHDNIGVQLLGALHSRAPDRKDAMIRETLSDLRDIINNASRPGLSFDETLADLRVEIAEHLSSAGIDLDWSTQTQGAPVLPPQAVHALRSVIREASGNVIKHASASGLRIHIAHCVGGIAMVIEDDGCGFDPCGATVGNGLTNMRTRMVGLGGTFEIVPGAAGTRITVQFPLSIAKASP